jgi:hypothetical protein
MFTNKGGRILARAEEALERLVDEAREEKGKGKTAQRSLTRL